MKPSVSGVVIYVGRTSLDAFDAQVFSQGFTRMDSGNIVTRKGRLCL